MPYERRTEAVREQLLGELAVLLELLDQLGHLGADGHALQRDHVALAGVDGAEEVGEADAVVLRLPREHEPLELDIRVLRVVDDQLVAVRVAGEVADTRLRVQVVLLAPHALQLRRKPLVLAVALDDLPPFLALLAAAAPVQLEQHVAVEVGEDVVEVHVDVLNAPERRLG
jgi:hypothetical protein